MEKPEDEKMTYAGVGVNYEQMDPFKRKATMLARETAKNLMTWHAMKEVDMSRGESAYLIDMGDRYLAHVEEGLGTKNLVADAVEALAILSLIATDLQAATGKSYYDAIAQDTVAMIVNDMITLGARPLSVAMHLAVGNSDWFDNEQRIDSLLTGWRKACDLAQCAWGGGETPTLKDLIVHREAVVVAGSAVGQVYPKRNLIDPKKIVAEDVIVLLESSGIHANGLTLARRIGEKESYLKKLPDGRTFGETLLAPTHIYVPLIAGCQRRGVDIHYAINITGHGWRKLMRAEQPFAYVIDQLPPQQPIFDFLQKHGPMSEEEAYGNLNMGAGFALILPRGEVPKVARVLAELGNPYRATLAGRVMRSRYKRVEIEPKNIIFEAETLQVR